MAVTTRAVDVERDRELVVALHGQANYAGESSWARGTEEAAYVQRWLATPQVVSFLQQLELSTADPRTMAEIWEEDGEPLGFLWVTFTDVDGYDVCIAEVGDLAVVAESRGRGVGSAMMRHIEKQARQRGAHVLRSDVGAGNDASRALHEGAGFAVERQVFEKVLTPPPAPGE